MKFNLLETQQLSIRKVSFQDTAVHFSIKEGKIIQSTGFSIPKSSIKLELESENNKLNQITIHLNKNFGDFGIVITRLDFTEDGQVWVPMTRIKQENLLNDTILINFNYIYAKSIILYYSFDNSHNSSKDSFIIDSIETSFSGVRSILQSSQFDETYTCENLIFKKNHSHLNGWSSLPSSHTKEEFILFDFGFLTIINELLALSTNDSIDLFPKQFEVYYSLDQFSWSLLFHENDFTTMPNSWYKWSFSTVQLRYLKFVIKQSKKNLDDLFQSKIQSMKIFSIDSDQYIQSHSTIKYASVLHPGIVRLALNGESAEGLSVQSNDSRLNIASTNSIGLVRLARDGENKEGVVVQSNDKRLGLANVNTYGLVRLAKNLESAEGKVLQSNDERLNQATAQSLGIVQLGENNETRKGFVVQCNDERLSKATSKKDGIVRISELGEELPNTVIVANDPRLKRASTESFGIVRVAYNGEESNDAVVTGDDKRLRLATTETFGIVQLSRSGESKENTVVQANDERLKKANFDNAGIVEIAKHLESHFGKVVLSDDPRLFDKRDPKSHSHSEEYAEKNHDFNSHTGLIEISGDISAENSLKISPTLDQKGVVSAKNQSKNGFAIVGSGKDSGIIGVGENFGIRGDSIKNKTGAGVIGISEEGFGGKFLSNSNFALLADGMGNQKFFEDGDGKAILAKGKSLFHGMVNILAKSECISKYYFISKSSVISNGDVVVFTNQTGILEKSKIAKATNVFGIIVETSSIVFGEESQEDKEEFYQKLVAFSGIVEANIFLEDGISVQPGDLLVTTGIEPGHLTKFDGKNGMIGCIVGKALASTKEKISKIPILISIT